MHKRGRATLRITSGEQLQRLNRKSSPGSGEHYRAFTSGRILSGQRRIRAPVFTGASLWVVLLWWHHQRDQKEQGSGAIKREETGYLQREGGMFKLRRVFIKLFSRHHAEMERLHLGDSTAVRGSRGDTEAADRYHMGHERSVSLPTPRLPGIYKSWTRVREFLLCSAQPSAPAC